MIDGAMIRLRTWQENDLPAITLLRNDIALQAQLLARVRGSGAEQVRIWLENRSTKHDELFFIISDRNTDAALGFIQIIDMDLVDQRADLGICLIRESQGRGLGSESLHLISAYLRDIWNLRKLSLRVRADNVTALRCYTKFGFKNSGVLREHVFIDGVWHDIILMEFFIPRKA